MSIADAVRARELEARVTVLEQRLAVIEQRLATIEHTVPQPSVAAKAFVQNIERAQSGRQALKTDNAA